jgi:hypothetical protein
MLTYKCLLVGAAMVVWMDESCLNVARFIITKSGTRLRHRRKHVGRLAWNVHLGTILFAEIATITTSCGCDSSAMYTSLLIIQPCLRKFGIDF